MVFFITIYGSSKPDNTDTDSKDSKATNNANDTIEISTLETPLITAPATTTATSTPTTDTTTDTTTAVTSAPTNTEKVSVQKTSASPTKKTSDTSSDSSSNSSDRYFSDDLSIEEIKQKSTEISKKNAKQILYDEIDEHWSTISSYLNQTNKKKVYALFLGFATRESTIDIGHESGQNSNFPGDYGHSFGILQTAITSYHDSNNEFKESDVTTMKWYPLTERNFYDPKVSTHSGIRHFLHFINQTKNEGNTGVDIIRNAFKGFNTGNTKQTNDTNYYTDYVDEIAALAGWYYNTDHFNDNEFTWHTDQRVDRSDPWGWWKN